MHSESNRHVTESHLPIIVPQLHQPLKSILAKSRSPRQKSPKIRFAESLPFTGQSPYASNYHRQILLNYFDTKTVFDKSGRIKYEACKVGNEPEQIPQSGSVRDLHQHFFSTGQHFNSKNKGRLTSAMVLPKGTL